MFPLSPAAVRATPPRAVSRTIRKIALLGSHSESLKACPWDDPSWELWGHASSRLWYARELDRYFDLHGKPCWNRAVKGGRYVKWLSRNTVPIMMQERYEAVPASVKYPRERILMEYGGVRRYFTNHLSWMIALAFSEGVTHLALFGINYGHSSEYQVQRGSAEYWLGRAEERGVHLLLSDDCTLLREPVGLYGYDSHDEQGRLRESYREKQPKPTIVPVVPGVAYELAQPPEHLKDDIAAEELDRPEWAKVFMTRTDGESRQSE